MQPPTEPQSVAATVDATVSAYAAVIRDFIESTVLFGDSSTIGDDDSLTESRVLDSTGVLEVISFLEDRYDVTFADTELTAENFDSISKIARFLDSKVG